MTPTPRWMSVVLYMAGAYNLAWGAFAVLAPLTSFAYSGMMEPGVPPNYPQLWQGMGLVIGLYGLAYAIAGTDPVRYWPIVLVGLISKVLGPIGLIGGVLMGQGRPEGILMNVPNDFLWWVPFALIVRHGYRTPYPPGSTI